MAKKLNAQRAAWQEAARERVRVVVEQKYQGNQTELANALGVARSLISIVLREVQPPTKNLMARLGTIPGISPRWAADGSGEAFGPDTSGTLAVASGILPGWPERHSELLTGERHPTAEAYIRPSRYWYRVEPTCPALRAAELALLANDMLLLDANSALWAERMDQSIGKMFGVRVRRGEQVSYTLALLRRDPIGLILDTFAEHDRSATPSPSSPAPAKPKTADVGIERLKRKVRKLKPVEEDTDATSEAKPTASAQVTRPSDVPFLRVTDIVQPVNITPEDVVAVRVGLYRA